MGSNITRLFPEWISKIFVIVWKTLELLEDWSVEHGIRSRLHLLQRVGVEIELERLERSVLDGGGSLDVANLRRRQPRPNLGLLDLFRLLGRRCGRLWVHDHGSGVVVEVMVMMIDGQRSGGREVQAVGVMEPGLNQTGRREFVRRVRDGPTVVRVEGGVGAIFQAAGWRTGSTVTRLTPTMLRTLTTTTTAAADWR